MKQRNSKSNVSIRIDPEILHQAKINAVIAKKTIGEWLAEAIEEKIQKENKK
jgi:hypothetical protein